MPHRVFHFVETLQIGGTETQAVQTALRQHAKGEQVTVGCLRAEGPLLDSLHRAGIPIVEFRKPKKLLSIQGIWQVLRMATFLRRERFHILHAHDLMSNLAGVIAARLAGIPIIISSRRYLDLEWWCGAWRNRIATWIYNQSTRVVVNSKSIRDLLVRREGVPEQKIHVIHNAIDADCFNEAIAVQGALSFASEDSKLVAVVANMYSPVKGHATLVAAAKHVCLHAPHVLFLLIGDGTERPKIEQQVKDAGLQKHFLFLGSRGDIPQLLAACDLFVLPSESEGMPNALLEAMASGLPAIATAVGGVPEVIEHNVTGLMVPPCDPAALSKAILALLNNEDLRHRLARAGRERVVRHFSFDRLMSVLNTLYAELSEAHLVRKSRPAPLQTLAAGTVFVDQVNE